MRFLPLFADLSSGTVALIGVGAPARAKLRLLRSAGASVRWFSGDEDVSDELLMAVASPGRVAVDPSIRCRLITRATSPSSPPQAMHAMS